MKMEKKCYQCLTKLVRGLLNAILTGNLQRLFGDLTCLKWSSFARNLVGEPLTLPKDLVNVGCNKYQSRSNGIFNDASLT